MRVLLLCIGLSFSTSCHARQPAATQPAPPATTAACKEKGEPLSPRAGVDIAPSLPAHVERAAPPSNAPAMQLDLGADRPALKLGIPRIDRASTASFSVGQGRRGWITRLATGEHLPSVAYGGGRVFVSGGFNTTSFYAMEAGTGRLLWDRQNLEDNGPTAPLFEDEEVIFNTESCTLFVLDARTGRTRWKRWLGDPTLAQAAAQHGLIFASYPSPKGQQLAALRLKDGRTVWARPVERELISAPVVAGDSVYATSLGGVVYRFGARDGKHHWARALQATSAPWIDGDRIYLSRQVGARTEALIALDRETGRARTELRRSEAAYLGDVPRRIDGDGGWPRVWAFEGSRPLLAAGRLLDTSAGVASALEPTTGKLLWSRADPKQQGRRAFTPPVVAGSQLVLSARRGLVYALDVDTGMTVWSYDVGRPIASSPIVARGWVYLSTRDGSVIGLEVGSPAVDGWHMWGGGPGHNGSAASPAARLTRGAAPRPKVARPLLPVRPPAPRG